MIEKELNKLAELYRISKLDVARSCYDDVAFLIIEQEPEERRKGLNNLYGKLKEDGVDSLHALK